MEDEDIIPVAEYECVSLRRIVPDALISPVSVNAKFDMDITAVREAVSIGVSSA